MFSALLQKLLRLAFLCSLLVTAYAEEDKPIKEDKAFMLPPDPGEAGKAILEGIDSDNDGVRDDLQIAIYERFPEDKYEEVRKVLLQRAKGVQGIILAGASGDATQIENAQAIKSRSIDCALLVEKSAINQGLFTRYETDEILFDWIYRLAINTDERGDAERKYNQYWSGKVISGKRIPNPCD